VRRPAQSLAEWSRRAVSPGDQSRRAVFMHPVSADASASVLPWRDRPSAAFASLTGSTRPDAVRHRERSFGLAEPDRAEGCCYRKAEASGAEMVQVRRAYQRADLCSLLSAHTS
jgi:hypothetical protein